MGLHVQFTATDIATCRSGCVKMYAYGISLCMHICVLCQIASTSICILVILITKEQRQDEVVSVNKASSHITSLHKFSESVALIRTGC